MKIVVPLAGPDFIDDNGQVRAAQKVDEVPILKKVLDSRPWICDRYESGFSDLYFVLLDRFEAKDFFSKHLSEWYPGCHAVYIPHSTKGAASSALVAISLFSDLDTPICVDLADIKFKWDVAKPEKLFSNSLSAGLIPIFRSNKSYYSYVVTDEHDDILASREKEVISELASAGVYFFRSPKDYMYALSYLLQHDKLKYNDLLYLCPLANAFSNSDKKMKAVYVEDVEDYHRAIN